MSVDPVNGYIYVVYATKSINGDADVMLVKSTNNGISWSTPLKINNDNTNTDQWFPWVDISPSGEINVVFYDSRVDPVNNDLSEVYIARSTDGGSTFSNFNVSNTPFQPQALPNSPSGYFMGDYIGITSANQKAFPIWTDNTSGTFQIYTSKVDFNQSVTVDQKREGGTSLTGTTVAKWEGSSFVNYQVPAIFNFSVGSSVVLRGLQDIVQSPSEKFNKWNIDANVINHRAVTIVPGTNQIVSQFKTTQSGTTIKNQLLESSLTGNGTIDFADPWLIDFNESPYGMRNQGMIAPFKSRTSPFSPDYTTSYGSDVYKGVFLNQDYNIPGQPYYSVRAQSTQTINGIQSYFQGWNASGATVQNPNALETPVVFTSSNTVVSANFKGHLVSNVTTGFSTNSQRKIVRTDDGKLHLVYESMNQVWYTRSTDGGNTWLQEQKVDNSGSSAKSPSLAQSGDGLNKIYIVYQRAAAQFPNNNSKIILAEFNNGVKTWSMDVYNLSSYDYDTKPVVAAMNQTASVVFKPTASSSLRAKKFYCSNGGCTIWSSYPDFQITYTDANSVNPSFIAYNGIKYYLAYQNGTTEIRYLELSADLPDVQSYEYNVISSGSGYTYNERPSISTHLGDPIVSWSASTAYWPNAGVRRKTNGTWSNFQSFSANMNYTNNNSTESGTDGTIIAWRNVVYNKSQFVKFYNGSYSSVINLPVADAQGEIQISNGYNFDNIKAVIFNNNVSQPYPVIPVSYSFNYLQKSVRVGGSNDGRMIVAKKNGNEFVYYLGNINVDGSKISFVDYIDTLKMEKPEQLEKVMITESFKLDSNSDFNFVTAYYSIDGKSKVELTDEDEIEYSIELVNGDGNKFATNLRTVKYDRMNKEKDMVNMRLNSNSLNEGTYQLAVKCKVKGSAEFYINNFQLADEAVLSKENIVEINPKVENLITDYSLKQNYPNPFNPTTKISFAIPQKSQIKLKVFDILGREVANLADGVYETGKYEVTFDASNLPSGVYFYNLTTASGSISKKMLLIK